MSNINNTTPASKEARRGFFGKLANGDFGLAKTYWLYGVLVGICINILAKKITSIDWLLFLTLMHAAYEVPVVIGTWKAAEKYKGSELWAVLARIATVLGAFILLISLLAVFRLRD